MLSGREDVVGGFSSAVILLLASVPAFAGGLLEDLVKRVTVTSRLLFTFVSAAAAFIAP